MTDDNDNDADVGNLDDTLCEILCAPSKVATSLDLDLAFGAVDVNDDLACTSLLSPLSPQRLIVIRSAVDISHPRQQGNAGSSAASGPVRSDIINGLGAGAVGGGGGNPSLVSSMPPGVVPGPVDSASAPPSSGRGNYLPTQGHRITVPLRVPRLVVPPLALTVSTRKPMYARMPPL